MERRYARICWNSSGWRYPTGEASKLEDGSYVAKNGFGHEEWLFNFDLLLPAYSEDSSGTSKYGFVQSMGKFYKTYRGNDFDVLLYTFPPDREPKFVARIRPLHMPMEGELEWAVDEFKSRSWMAMMKNQIESLGCDPSLLDDPVPFHILNGRFNPEDVEFFNPMIRVPEDHKIRSMFRYQPMIWPEHFKIPGI